MHETSASTKDLDKPSEALKMHERTASTKDLDKPSEAFDLYRPRTISFKDELEIEIPIYKVGKQPNLGSSYPCYYQIGFFDRRLQKTISYIEYEISLALFKSDTRAGRFQVSFRYWQDFDFGTRRRTVLLCPRDKMLSDLLPRLESVIIEELSGDVQNLPEVCWFEDGAHLQSGRTMRTDVMTTKDLEAVEILQELSENGNLMFVGWIFTRDPSKWLTELVICGEREGLSGTYYLKDLDERYPMWVLSGKKTTAASRQVTFHGRPKEPKADGATMFDLRTRTINIKEELECEIPIYRIGKQPILGSKFPCYYKIGFFDRRLPKNVSYIEYEIKLALFKSDTRAGRFQVRFRYWQDFGAHRRTAVLFPRDKVLMEVLPRLESVIIEELRGDLDNLPEVCWFEDGSHLQSDGTTSTDVMSTKGLEAVEMLREVGENGNLKFVGWIFTRDPAKRSTEVVICGEREGLSGTYYLKDLDKRYPMLVLSPKPSNEVCWDAAKRLTE